MNQFLVAAKRAVNQHGLTSSYISVQEGAYNIETGSTTNTETTYSVKMYKKHIRASQYNYPNLIGRDAGIFYLVNDSLAFVPSVRDKIVYGTDTYQVDSIQSHVALGAVVLYRIVAVKG